MEREKNPKEAVESVAAEPATRKRWRIAGKALRLLFLTAWTIFWGVSHMCWPILKWGSAFLTTIGFFACMAMLLGSDQPPAWWWPATTFFGTVGFMVFMNNVRPPIFKNRGDLEFK